MSIEITARHLKISQDLQAFAREKAAGLMEEFPKIEFVHVVLDALRGQFMAEFVVQHKDLAKAEAAETCEDMTKAIDLACGKIEKQLRKHRDKVVAAHHRRA